MQLQRFLRLLHIERNTTIIIVTAALSGCFGTIKVTSTPPGAMVYRASYSTPQPKGDLGIIGIPTPLVFTRRDRIEGVKARWSDGSESEWEVTEPDFWGGKSASFHFDKTKAIIPKTGNRNWWPPEDPMGYVEFYKTINGKKEDLSPICQLIGTECCGLRYRKGPSSSGRLWIPCPVGLNHFLLFLGENSSPLIVDVKEGLVTPIHINCTVLSSDSSQTSTFNGTKTTIETISDCKISEEPQQPFNPRLNDSSKEGTLERPKSDAGHPRPVDAAATMESAAPSR